MCSDGMREVFVEEELRFFGTPDIIADMDVLPGLEIVVVSLVWTVDTYPLSTSRSEEATFFGAMFDSDGGAKYALVAVTAMTIRCSVFTFRTFFLPCHVHGAFSELPAVESALDTPRFCSPFPGLKSSIDHSDLS